MLTVTSSLGGLALLVVCLHGGAADRNQCPDPALGPVVSQQNSKLINLIERLQTAEYQVKDLEPRLQSSQKIVQEMKDELRATQAEVEQLKSDISKQRGKPSFRAVLQKPVTAGTPILFDQEFSTRGVQYNPQTGKYSVPISGVYLFGFQLFPTFLTDMLIDLYVDGVIMSRSRCYNSNVYTTSCAASALLHLTAGDEIWVQSNKGGQYHKGPHSFFFGALFSPDH